MQTQLKWLTTYQALEDRLRVLVSRRRTRRCLEEIESLEKEKNRVRQRIQPALLRRFEILLERRQGKAIIPIRGRSCGACGLVLPAQTVIDVQTTEFVITCESCNRFLYWDREEALARRKAREELAAKAKAVEPAKKRRTPKATNVERCPSAKKRKPVSKKPTPKTTHTTRTKAAAEEQVTMKKKAAAEKKSVKKKTSSKKKTTAKKETSKRTTTKTAAKASKRK